MHVYACILFFIDKKFIHLLNYRRGHKFNLVNFCKKSCRPSVSKTSAYHGGGRFFRVSLPFPFLTILMPFKEWKNYYLAMNQIYNQMEDILSKRQQLMVDLEGVQMEMTEVLKKRDELLKQVDGGMDGGADGGVLVQHFANFDLLGERLADLEQLKAGMNEQMKDLEEMFANLNNQKTLLKQGLAPVAHPHHQ